jgi:hypothetical protein
MSTAAADSTASSGHKALPWRTGNVEAAAHQAALVVADVEASRLEHLFQQQRGAGSGFALRATRNDSLVGIPSTAGDRQPIEITNEFARIKF